MPDYKELFYRSQAEIANIIEQLSKLENHLKEHMIECEEKVVGDKNNGRDRIININVGNKGSSGMMVG